KPFNIFTHGGLSGWIAIRYASKHPEGVKRMVLCSTQANVKNGFMRSQKQLEQQGKAIGDIEMEHLAQSMLINQNGKRNYETQNEDENRALTRKSFTTYFANAA